MKLNNKRNLVKNNLSENFENYNQRKKKILRLSFLHFTFRFALNYTFLTALTLINLKF